MCTCACVHISAGTNKLLKEKSISIEGKRKNSVSMKHVLKYWNDQTGPARVFLL